MAEPQRTSPFDGLPGRLAAATAGCRLTPLAAESRLVLRCDRAGAAAAAAALGIEPPAMLRQSTASNVAMAMLGPDDYLLRGGSAEPLEAALTGRHHALVDVSHRLTGVRLMGETAAATLAGGCPLDLHQRTAPVGLATRTLIGKTEITLIRTSADGFDLLTNRSFADYLWHLLLELGRDQALTTDPA